MSRKRSVFDRLMNDPALSPETRDAAAVLLEWHRQNGRTGGQARAQRHSREKLAEWGGIRYQKAASDHIPPNS